MLGLLERSTLVELEASSGSWSKVRAGRKTGWVASKYLALPDSLLAPRRAAEEFSWMPIALAEQGQLEVPGSEHNPRILAYHAATELDKDLAAEDETPWCSSFVCWSVEHAGYCSTNSAWARSWLGWGHHLTRPRRGVIAVFSRGSGGHVGFFISETKTHVTVYGGNQRNRVCFADYAKERLLGYRVP